MTDKIEQLLIDKTKSGEIEWDITSSYKRCWFGLLKKYDYITRNYNGYMYSINYDNILTVEWCREEIKIVLNSKKLYKVASDSFVNKWRRFRDIENEFAINKQKEIYESLVTTNNNQPKEPVPPKGCVDWGI